MANHILLVNTQHSLKQKKKAIVKQSKVDITNYKKMCKAFLIMLVDANRNLSPSSRLPSSLAVEFNTRSTGPYSYYKTHTSEPFTIKRPSRGRSSVWSREDDLHVPQRCKSLARAIKKEYPRMSDILPKDRLVIIETTEHTEESVSWAESVAKEAGADTQKDKLATAVETQTRTLTAFLDGDVGPKVFINRFSKQVTKTLFKTSISEPEVRLV